MGHLLERELPLLVGFDNDVGGTVPKMSARSRVIAIAQARAEKIDASTKNIARDVQPPRAPRVRARRA